jgi:hypothetical protein
MGITPRGEITLAQTIDGEQEQVITLSPDQVEMLVSSLRIAVEVLRAPGSSGPAIPPAPGV